MSLCLVTLSLLVLLGGRETDADWVEIPQFSDQQKVYKLPVKLQTHRKYQQGLHSNDRRFDSYFQKIGLDREISMQNISKLSENNFPLQEDDIAGTIANFTTERIITSIVSSSEDNMEINIDKDITIESMEDHPQFDIFPALYGNQNYISSTPRLTDGTIISTTTITDFKQKQQHEKKPKDDKGFIEFLPIDLLKKVHKTLKSQPPTLKGKIRFLKAFECTLLSEIESRVSAAFAPLRIPRQARGYDYHDEGIGFPSLEGTLMAISFLTFAVYLIRLVMTLFRNATNNNAAPSIFIGRKRRSVDDSNEHIARILDYLDSPGPYIKE